MDFETSTTEELEPLGSLTPYTVIISSHIYERLEKHITILKKLVDRSATKQRWIVDAIKEKLLNDANSTKPPKASTLNVKIESKYAKELAKRIEYIKKFRVTYSKKQWIVDAVIEKLDRDEKDVEKKMFYVPSKTKDLMLFERIEQMQSELESLKSGLEK